MAAQAGLRLVWSETPEDTFCRVVAHIFPLLPTSVHSSCFKDGNAISYFRFTSNLLALSSSLNSIPFLLKAFSFSANHLIKYIDCNYRNMYHFTRITHVQSSWNYSMLKVEIKNKKYVGSQGGRRCLTILHAYFARVLCNSHFHFV